MFLSGMMGLNTLQFRRESTYIVNYCLILEGKVALVYESQYIFMFLINTCVGWEMTLSPVLSADVVLAPG